MGFSAACVNVCGLLVVQLDLNAQSIVPPVKDAKRACNVALKGFLRQFPDCRSAAEEVQIFGELFVSAVRKLHLEWMARCASHPRTNMMHFGEVLQSVSHALDFALCTSDKPEKTLENVNIGKTGFRCWVARVHSGLLCFLLSIARFICCAN